jgi:hypothetical protein
MDCFASLAMTKMFGVARQIDPTGKSFVATKTCLVPVDKIFRLTRRANQRYQLAPSFPGKRGGSRVVTNAGEDAVDAAASARKIVRRAVFP